MFLRAHKLREFKARSRSRSSSRVGAKNICAPKMRNSFGTIKLLFSLFPVKLLLLIFISHFLYQFSLLPCFFSSLLFLKLSLSNYCDKKYLSFFSLFKTISIIFSFFSQERLLQYLGNLCKEVESNNFCYRKVGRTVIIWEQKSKVLHCSRNIEKKLTN